MQFLKKRAYGNDDGDTTTPVDTDCQYVVKFDFENPGSEPQDVACSGNYCMPGGGSFDFSRTLPPNSTQSKTVNKCVDFNSLTYSVSYVTPVVDLTTACM